MDGSLKDPTFRGGGSRKTNIEGELPKKGGALKQFADLRGGEGAWQERGGWCFWGEVDTPMHIVYPFMRALFQK